MHKQFDVIDNRIVKFLKALLMIKNIVSSPNFFNLDFISKCDITTLRFKQERPTSFLSIYLHLLLSYSHRLYNSMSSEHALTLYGKFLSRLSFLRQLIDLKNIILREYDECHITFCFLSCRRLVNLNFTIDPSVILELYHFPIVYPSWIPPSIEQHGDSWITYYFFPSFRFPFFSESVIEVKQYYASNYLLCRL